MPVNSKQGISYEIDSGYIHKIAARRKLILSDIERICDEVDRDPSTVKIIAVSKSVGVDEVEAALEVGYTIFGENRPQELVLKTEALSERGIYPRFDLIGALQRNKINSILGRAQVIHSIASEKLAAAVSSRVEREGLRQAVLLQVNVSGEASKDGMSPSELREAAERIGSLPGLSVNGFMTMAPQGGSDEVRSTFKGLAELLEELHAGGHGYIAEKELSMGMSGDYETAIRHGATMIRLGRIVFDPDFSVN